MLFMLFPCIYTSEKILNLSIINKTHPKCNVIDGSIQDGVRQPILFSFVLDKLSGYKVVCEPEAIHYKKLINSVLNTITFFIEDDTHQVVDFNGENLNFTLQMLKIRTNKFTYNYMSIYLCLYLHLYE